MSDIQTLLDRYSTGCDLLRTAVEQISASDYDAIPVAGKWSVRQVVCHIADFEPIYADRMKRVLVEDNPTFFGGNPDVFAAGLAYHTRDVAEELQLIDMTRRQLSIILKNCDIEDFQRTGVHSDDGPITLETLLERITGHIPHHAKFIDEKAAALNAVK
ncbi:MAG: DinB family protein [Fuerstiella sp.]